ncbi:hypothetical protein TKK_0016425 [Trichogramma kaykai]
MGPILLCVIFVAGVYLMITFYLHVSDYLESNTALRHIPSPGNLPFVGLSWQWSRIAPENRFKWFNELCYSFKRGIIVTWFGLHPIVNVRKPDQIKTVLKSYCFVQKSQKYKLLRPWLGKGLLISNDEYSEWHRSLISRTFHQSRNDDFIEIIQKKVTILLEQIQLEINKNVKEPIDILHLMSKYSLDVVCENVLGVDLDCQRVPFNPYVEALQKLCNVSIDRYYEFLMKWDYLFYKTAKGRELMTAIDIVREFTEEIIKQRISLRKNTEEKPKCKSFLDALLDVYEEFKYESTVTIEQIREELDAYIFSAYSATSAAISWALFALGNAQKAQARVSAEMREAAESTSSKPASIRQLLDLKYLDRVAKEVLRLYPSVPTVGRCLEKDLVLDFYFIPKGTQVDLHVYQLHHDPDVWDDPERFEPDRFLPENCNVRHSHAYAPFADGPRACLGRDQALLEMKLVLSALLAKWRVYSCLRPAEMKLRADFNLRPADDKISMYFFPVDRTTER